MKRTVAFFFALCLAGSSWAQEWAWEAGQQSHNGAIAVQSASGGTTHTLPQNPLAAVAKTDQSAVTQPPTIIVQSTGNAEYKETVPLVKSGLTIPSCPAGYSSIWSQAGSSCPAHNTYNVGGSRFSFGYINNAGTQIAGFIGDHLDENNTSRVALPGVNCSPSWSANLCVK